MTRVPLCEVEAYLHADIVDHAEPGNPRAAFAYLARRLGTNRTQLRRWRAYGLTWIQADEVATRLGVWPGQLWDGWETAADEDIELELEFELEGVG